MQIKRVIDGKLHKIELTEEEIFAAYKVQQFTWDKDFCRTKFVDLYKDEDWFKKLSVNDFDGIIVRMASCYRELINKDHHEEYAFSKAEEEALKDYNIEI